MRKFLLLILLASAASPAFAAQDRDDPPNRRGHRAERTQNESDAPRREAPAAVPQREQIEQRSVQTRGSEAGNEAAVMRRAAPDRDVPRAEPVQPIERREAGGAVRSLQTTSAIRSIAYSTSSVVLNLPIPMRIVESACSAVSPSALKT